MGVHSTPRFALVGAMQTSHGMVTVEDLVSAMRRGGASTPDRDWRLRVAKTGDLAVNVHGAQSGAGASTVAVALVDVLGDRTQGDVTLIDLARTGDFGATEGLHVRTDLGLRGWTGGRRGRTKILRLDPSVEPAEIAGAAVLDVCGTGGVPGLDVLVCRPTIPSARCAESALRPADLTAIAVVGNSKWPAAVRRCLGPRLTEAIEDRRTVFFPHDRNLEVGGLSADPLPSSTLKAARRLLDLLAELREPTATADPEEVPA